jgi:hypothetical protein
MSIVDTSAGKTTLDTIKSNDDIPMWNAIQQSEEPKRAAEGGLLVYDATTQQYKRLPDASDPVPYPVIDATVKTLIGALTDAAVTDPAATEATLLGLLRGLLTKAATVATDPATATLQTAGNTLLTTLTGVDFATEAKQDTGNTALANILAKLSSDPATSTNQSTANTSLANLDIALTTLRDAILGTNSKTLTDIVTVLGSVVLAAGTSVVGKFGIDQTTPGTTNAITPVNSSSTEILTETDPGVFKIGSVGIIIPTDKQAVYRHAEIDYTTPLGVSPAAYTSSAIDGLTLKRVTGTVYADQAGELHFEHSKDGTNWRRTRSISVVASTPQSFDEPFYSRYQRLIYANGATAQGAFELVAYSAAE